MDNFEYQLWSLVEYLTMEEQELSCSEFFSQTFS